MTSAVPRLSPALSGRVWGSHAAPLSCAVCRERSPAPEAGAHQSPFPGCQFYSSLFPPWFYLTFLMALGAKPSNGCPHGNPYKRRDQHPADVGQEQSKTWKAPGSAVSKGAGS